jgi:simple sugar transport system ATP-binding protein
VTAAEQGAAVLWFAAELDELFAVCDRIVVLVTGRPSRHFAPPFDRAAIGAAMAGVTEGIAEGVTEGATDE